MLCTSIRTESLSVFNTVHKGACSYDGFTFKECSDYQTALVTVTGTIVTNWIGCIAKFWFSIHGSLQDCVYTSKKKKKQQLTSNMYKHKFNVYVVNQLSTTTMYIQLVRAAPCTLCDIFIWVIINQLIFSLRVMLWTCSDNLSISLTLLHGDATKWERSLKFGVWLWASTWLEPADVFSSFVARHSCRVCLSSKPTWDG